MVDAEHFAKLPGIVDVSGTESALLGFWMGRRRYAEGCRAMENLWRARWEGRVPDVALYLEHEPVLTYGRATPPADLGDVSLTVPKVEVARGGKATYHGPGQLVGYVILDLRARRPGQDPDLHDYLRALENGLVEYLRAVHSLDAIRREGWTGVWIQDPRSPRKIASIGIAVRRWVTLHGFALNVSNDLEIFRRFSPCGLDGNCMTSLAREFGLESEWAGDLVEIAASLHGYLEKSLQQAGWLGERSCP